MGRRVMGERDIGREGEEEEREKSGKKDSIETNLVTALRLNSFECSYAHALDMACFKTIITASYHYWRLQGGFLAAD